MDDVYQDIGYTRGLPMGETYVLRKNYHENSIRVEFISGMNKGKIQWLRVDIAEDLIKRGVAIEYGKREEAI